MRLDLELRRCDKCGELQEIVDGEPQIWCNEDGEACCQECLDKEDLK